MGLRRIAFAVGEPLLLTLDGHTLLAFDAADARPRWTLDFPRMLAGVLYTSMGVLPPAVGGSPWRSPSSTSSIAIVVDIGGAVHVVDAGTGTLLGELEKAESPLALASAPDAVAIATLREVLLYREGARIALPYRATALAFARDGAKLALGTKSEVVIADVSSPTTIAKVNVRGPVTDLAARPGGGWLVGNAHGVRTIAARALKTERAIDDVTVASLALDRGGTRVAIVRSGAAAVVFDLPADGPRHRIFSHDPRAIEDVAFGEANLLGVALDGGDACIVNLATCAVQRSEPHEGRPRRSGAIRVEEVRPEPEAPPSSKSDRSSMGARLGGGALAMVILAVVRMAMMSSRSTPAPPPLKAFESIQRCDPTCERRRLDDLRNACATICEVTAERALAAFDAHHCAEVHGALQSIRAELVDAGTSHAHSAILLAQLGLKSGCIDVAPVVPGTNEP